MNKNNIRIQAYIDSDLSQLLTQYAETRNLTSSAAAAQILRDFFIDNQSNDSAVVSQPTEIVFQVPRDELAKDFVTRSEFEALLDSLRAEFLKIDERGYLSSVSSALPFEPKSKRSSRRLGRNL